MSDGYKFPDELGLDGNYKNEVDINVDAETDIDIVIEDDTPERDRRAQPLNREVEDPTDEEIEQYSKSVQARIKELTHARHDERRAKESLARERDELEKLAQSAIDENRRLKQYVQSGEASFAETLKEKAEAELEMARRNYKVAADSYDSDVMLEAQEKLTEAKLKLEAAKNFKPTPLQNDSNNATIEAQIQQKPRLDEKTLRWQAKNQWFGSPGYEDITAFALGLHQKLVATGYDPRTDEYFERVDSRMKQVFPEMFRSEDESARSEPTRKPATVVASATRSTGAKKQVNLTATAKRIADKFGLSYEEYAKQALKLENSNG